jgi:hypothetical protein
MANSIDGMAEQFYWTPALYVTTYALRHFMPALRACDLKAISEASVAFDEFQQFIEKSYRDRKYLR